MGHYIQMDVVPLPNRLTASQLESSLAVSLARGPPEGLAGVPAVVQNDETFIFFGRASCKKRAHLKLVLIHADARQNILLHLRRNVHNVLHSLHSKGCDGPLL